MKMGTEQARSEIFRVMLRHNGNRAKAAKDLEISLRTLYRYLDDYNMHPILERCGWQQNAGPPRGGSRGLPQVRGLILEHIRRGKGHVDMGRLSMEVWGEDSPQIRRGLFEQLDVLRRMGVVTFDGIDRYEVVKAP